MYKKEKHKECYHNVLLCSEVNHRLKFNCETTLIDYRFLSLNILLN